MLYTIVFSHMKIAYFTACPLFGIPVPSPKVILFAMGNKYSPPMGYRRRQISILIIVVSVMVIATVTVYRRLFARGGGGGTSPQGTIAVTPVAPWGVPVVTTVPPTGAPSSRGDGGGLFGTVLPGGTHHTHTWATFAATCRAVRLYEHSPLHLAMRRVRDETLGGRLSSGEDTYRKIKRVKTSLLDDTWNHIYGKWPATATPTLPRIPAKPARRAKIACVMFAHRPHEFGASSRQYAEWGKHCDSFTFLSSSDVQYQGTIPTANVVTLTVPFGNQADNTWQRVRAAIRHVAESAGSSSGLDATMDYVFISGDDTVLLLDNVRAALEGDPAMGLLTNSRMSVPMLLGHRMVTTSGSVFVGQAGYLLNRHAVRMLMSLFESGVCNDGASGSDDLDLGDCLMKGGTYAFDSADWFDEDRVTMYDPRGLPGGTADRISPKDWYVGYRVRPMPKGMDAISVTPWLFHYIGDPASEINRIGMLE